MNKQVEITGYEFKDGDLHIFGNDVSEENLQRIERNRIDEDFENELTFCFVFTDKRKKKYHYRFLKKWLHEQKIIREQVTKPATLGEALNLIIGTVTDLPTKYRILTF